MNFSHYNDHKGSFENLRSGLNANNFRIGVPKANFCLKLCSSILCKKRKSPGDLQNLDPTQFCGPKFSRPTQLYGQFFERNLVS